MDAQAIIQAESDYIVNTYTRPEVVFTHGEGVNLYDEDGKSYLDFCAGIAVMALGHSDPEWAAAVADQAGKLTHVSNLYHTAPHVELAKRLVENSFADKVYFGNSGAEANEGAIKFARKFARKHGHDHKTEIVTFSGAFHGRTMGALAVTPKDKYQKYFKPFMPGVVVGEFNSVDSAESTINANTYAVIVEPIQGEGGIVPAKAAFLQRVRDLCDQHDALLIFDEVQCGLGRSGYLWAHEAYGIEPDIMTLAKPLAGGLPIGTVLCTDRVASTIEPGDHASTFGAGAIVCRAGQVVFDRVADPEFLAHVRSMGEHLNNQLQAKLPADQVVEIRGMGLMQGIELTHELGSLVSDAAAEGLLVVGAGANVLRLVPPLTVTADEIDQAVDILASCLTK